MSCPRCIQGFILPGEPTGTFQPDFHNAYLAPAPNGKPSKRAVFLFTDIFGLPLQNPMIMADTIAKELGCDVWVPDYFKGKPPMPLTTMIPDRAGVKASLWDWVKFVGVLLRNLPALINSRPAVVDKRLASLFALLKEKKTYEKIGAVGYCFGGTTAARLGSTKYLNSIVIVHPGPISDSVLKSISIPTAWACAEEDTFWPESERNKAEAVFAARKDTDKFVDYEFKVYKGTAHGFASRPNLELPEIKAAHEQALEQAIAWFQKTLTVSEPVKETTEG
ncbi:dienelactone hydrolase endo-1,3,1,4-beta-D-glucanase [Laccaria bicolor S238N-H82]|uniref:Dienelactone hydrolase endo-1,3,1,4-beta-D-glucanase n=1 Tax=Laccaria bicolor (strain S238N-H82 / ATCC MYA-4686) TaxID=486041 RepID=B0DUE9_LACBS|nr:dienelactone hydrolase endo-1,3,1,4-beta-D-glucanase [Laccaria bicolor S238N-H82]EDR01792.1 dienelactone hydrolase endo-1,3,1,4-beta-D-glucanase [Laccaria bicolor S238N-H82]|eukprot:XP_001887605.1 dienelactone hydrolase endo-1,3,1,4-beta-D-glucanase [Laccaria bicolor S238N-H82]